MDTLDYRASRGRGPRWGVIGVWPVLAATGCPAERDGVAMGSEQWAVESSGRLAGWEEDSAVDGGSQALWWLREARGITAVPGAPGNTAHRAGVS